MRTLRLGQTGEDVLHWQHFLVGLGHDVGEADGSFGPKTEAATKKFQNDIGVGADGVVGRSTLAEAIAGGFGDLHDDGEDEETSSTWPPRPSFGPLSGAERSRLFGTFAYQSTPTPGNPEAITITDGWAAKNIINAKGPFGKMTAFHRAAAPQFEALFAAWEAAGLSSLILTWGGSWVPRYVRGSRTYLSNHAWGTAFDINVAWNALGAQPALVGKTGSVRKLVALANEHGFYWGGHFADRPDGMHFEVAFIP